MFHLKSSERKMSEEIFTALTNGDITWDLQAALDAIRYF